MTGRTRCVFAALACACALTAIAQDGDRGLFEIRRASLELRGNVYYLDALATLQLSTDGRNALASGLPLGIRYELQFLNRLRLWWDTEEATLQQRYQIEFHALTERYLVTNMNTGDQGSFLDLDDALSAIGRIEDLPVIDAALLDADRRYEVRLRVLLDTETLPGPLRLLAFWRRDWSLGSDWQTWRLDDE
jgi:hypothetical protein